MNRDNAININNLKAELYLLRIAADAIQRIIEAARDQEQDLNPDNLLQQDHQQDPRTKR